MGAADLPPEIDPACIFGPCSVSLTSWLVQLGALPLRLVSIFTHGASASPAARYYGQESGVIVASLATSGTSR